MIKIFIQNLIRIKKQNVIEESNAVAGEKFYNTFQKVKTQIKA